MTRYGGLSRASGRLKRCSDQLEAVTSAWYVIRSLSGHRSRDRFSQPRQDKHCQDSAADQFDPFELGFQSRDVGLGGQFPAPGFRRVPHDGGESVRLVFLKPAFLSALAASSVSNIAASTMPPDMRPRASRQSSPRRLQSRLPRRIPRSDRVPSAVLFPDLRSDSDFKSSA